MARSKKRSEKDVRRRFALYLRGEGLEIGPGHTPFPVPSDVRVRYVDRWLPAENAELFPELSDPTFPHPHYVVNLDADRLSAFGDETQDFVIASHIFEHLANPLAMLEDIHRILRPRGLLILLLPDRHVVTFDRERRPTSVAHLRDEYRLQVREVDDDHLFEFILASYPERSEERNTSPSKLEWHRKRSIHAHVWDQDEFCEVLNYADAEMGIRWRKIASFSTGDEGSTGHEFGWVLRRRSRRKPSVSFNSQPGDRANQPGSDRSKGGQLTS